MKFVTCMIPIYKKQVFLCTSIINYKKIERDKSAEYVITFFRFAITYRLTFITSTTD